jgi:hypothetical protein
MASARGPTISDSAWMMMRSLTLERRKALSIGRVELHSLGRHLHLEESANGSRSFFNNEQKHSNNVLESTRIESDHNPERVTAEAPRFSQEAEGER